MWVREGVCGVYGSAIGHWQPFTGLLRYAHDRVAPAFCNAGRGHTTHLLTQGPARAPRRLTAQHCPSPTCWLEPASPGQRRQRLAPEPCRRTAICRTTAHRRRHPTHRCHPRRRCRQWARASPHPHRCARLGYVLQGCRMFALPWHCLRQVLTADDMGRYPEVVGQ